MFANERYRKMAQQQHPDRDLGLSKEMVTFIGVSELAGALGLVLPMATGVLPLLTPFAAVGLAVIMVLATQFHLKRQEPAWMTIMLFVMCAAVAAGRGLS